MKFLRPFYSSLIDAVMPASYNRPFKNRLPVRRSNAKSDGRCFPVSACYQTRRSRFFRYCADSQPDYELRAQGATVYQFEGGEPYRETPDYIKEGISAALRENKTRYAPSSGIPELRRAIAKKLRERNRIPADEENVIIVHGGMQGLLGSFQSVVNPGEDD